MNIVNDRKTRSGFALLGALVICATSQVVVADTQTNQSGIAGIGGSGITGIGGSGVEGIGGSGVEGIGGSGVEGIGGSGVEGIGGSGVEGIGGSGEPGLWNWLRQFFGGSF